MRWGINGFNRLATLEGEDGSGTGGANNDGAAAAAAAAAANAGNAGANAGADAAAAEAAKVAEAAKATEAAAAAKAAEEAAKKADPVKAEEARVKALTDARTANALKDDHKFTHAEGIEVNETALKEFSTVAKELGLNGKEAQRLIDLQEKLAVEHAKAGEAAWAKVHEAWDNELKSDKEFGGDNLEATKASARDVAQKIGGKELVDAIDALNLSGQPKLIIAFARIGKLMTEAKIDPATLKPAGAAKAAFGDPGFYDHPSSQTQ